MKFEIKKPDGKIVFEEYEGNFWEAYSDLIKKYPDSKFKMYGKKV